MGPSHGRAAAIDSARTHLRNRDFDKAEAALRAFVWRPKPDPEALFLLGIVFERSRRMREAAEVARRSISLHEHPEAVLLLARCERDRGATDEAVRLCDRALAENPGMMAALLIKGGALEAAGRFEEARSVIKPLMDAAAARGVPADPEVRLEWAKLLVQDKRFDEAIGLIDGLLVERLHEDLKKAALYVKAKACDRKGDYRGAYEAAGAANEIGRLEFSPELAAEQVSELISNWSREKMARFPVSACTSDLPVFIAGVPRSGTSLLDQIIDAHPMGAGVGELGTLMEFAHDLGEAWDPEKEPPACFGKFDSWRWTRTAEAYLKEIRALTKPGVRRIVNKSMGNTRLVGMIARLFPKTRIIHAIRDPRDVAVSCYQEGFDVTEGSWTTRYDWIARFWEQSMRMMEHWKKALDVPILDVHYERLIKHPDTEFPRIIEFLGLEWDDACREFYRSRRTVRTPSYDQVNRPLYTSSVGRHANYAPFMEGVEFPPYDPGV